MSNEMTHDLCFVLRAVPYKERDLVVALFSEARGRFGGIARNGVQSRRFGGCLDLFTASQFEMSPKTVRIQELNEEGLVQLLSAQSKFTPQTLGKSFLKLSAASVLNELVLRVVPLQKAAPEVFKLYSNAILALDETEEDQSIKMVNAFILKMSQWLGVQPSLTRCLKCEKALHEIPEAYVYLQIARGAWLCHSCFPKPEGMRLSKIVILDALHSMLEPIRKIQFQASVQEHELLLDALEKHLQYFVPGLDRLPLQSIRFLKQPIPDLI